MHTKCYIHAFEEPFSSLFINWKSHIFLCRFIRMSSPKFNNITVVGCLLCYSEVFVSAYSSSTSATHDPSLCYVRPFSTFRYVLAILGQYGIEALEREQEEGERARSEGSAEGRAKGLLSLYSLSSISTFSPRTSRARPIPYSCNGHAGWDHSKFWLCKGDTLHWTLHEIAS